MKRRATATLTLVLIGSTLHGCGDEEETAARDVYKTRADCQRDWGDDAANCEPQTSGPHAGLFYGPLLFGMASGFGRNRGAATLPPRQGSSAIGTTPAPVSRGGFGSSARTHSSGG